jgi:hypothetical protein
MPKQKPRENRKRRRCRRRREEARLERKRQAEALEAELSECWLCDCGQYIEDGCHCPHCGAEPPWGCPCDWCQGERYEEPDDYEPDFGDEDYFSEPVGSCEWCGVNLYPDDDPDLCDQCAWHAAQAGGSEGDGIQPVT